PGVDEPMGATPNEATTPVPAAAPTGVTEEKISAEAEAASLRDKEEISLPAEMAKAPAEVKEAEPVGTPAAATPEPTMSFVETPDVEPTEPTTAEPPAVEIPAEVDEPVFVVAAHRAEETLASESSEAGDAANEEPFFLEEEQVGLGKPIPQLT